MYIMEDGYSKDLYSRILLYKSLVIVGIFQGRIQGGGGWMHPARPPPPKIGKNLIFWRKIVIFHTKYPKNVFKCAPLTWNPRSAPVFHNPWSDILKLATISVIKQLFYRNKHFAFDVLCYEYSGNFQFHFNIWFLRKKPLFFNFLIENC